MTATVMVCLLGVMAQQANAVHAEVAGSLLVDLRSEDLAPGLVTQWPNHGSLGGAFTSGGAPVVQTMGGWDNVVYFGTNGASYFEGPISPDGICGAGTRSIEVWAYNVGYSSEECMVSWSHRGGPNGTNMNFNYGWATFGAAGHWGDAADMAWVGFGNGPAAGTGYPPLETWQYLAYTYDGTTCRLCVNGVENTHKAVTLNTHAGNVIRIGCENGTTGTPQVPDLQKAFTGAIAQVRIHDGVLTPEQIKTNADIRIQSFGQASKPTPSNDATDVALRNLVLSWEPGETAVTHTVYFSEDVNAVKNGTAASVSLTANSYDPGLLQFGKTYFWRVDENTAAPTTVFKGGVWSFTVEPVSYKMPGASITATASSSSSANSGPGKTVDGSGLDASDQHDAKSEDSWLSANAQKPPVWIQYQFDNVYKLDQMWVWNSNSGLEWLLGFGVKTATIEFSVDGITWTVLPGVPQFAQGTGYTGYAHNTTVNFNGAVAKFVRLTITSNWGGLAQYGLSEVRFFHIPVLARDPNPTTGAANMAPDATLSWRAGRDAAEHKVYFGTNQQAVTNGTVSPTTVQQTNYSPSLRVGTAYYWRVDEVNAAQAVVTWPGAVWSFTTIDHLVVDDMESYNDFTKPVYSTWIDGYGTTNNACQVGNNVAPYMNTATVHGGSKSMPFRYRISGAYTLSEATRTFDAAQNWTTYGITTLRLFFYGNTANTAAGLYVKINGTKINYMGDATNVSKAQWTQWDVPLSSVPASTLQSVTSLTIGTSTGAGDLLFDDMGLY